MFLPLYVEPRDVVEAEALIDQFGKTAGLEAADRAEASRNIGNHLHYCRWRQIERLIIMLSIETFLFTVPATTDISTLLDTLSLHFIL